MESIQGRFVTFTYNGIAREVSVEKVTDKVITGQETIRGHVDNTFWAKPVYKSYSRGKVENLVVVG